MSKVTLVRYRVKPDQAEQNEALVCGVYDELRQTAPGGLRYATFVQEDGVSFVHLSASEDDQSPLVNVGAFKKFLQGLDDRCEEPPVQVGLHKISSYGFWDEDDGLAAPSTCRGGVRRVRAPLEMTGIDTRR